jgi:hypothetical protein
MLKKFASLSCSFGLSVYLVCLVEPDHQTNRSTITHPFLALLATVHEAEHPHPC